MIEAIFERGMGAARRIRRRMASLFETRVNLKNLESAKRSHADDGTAVDAYWRRHTVNSKPFVNAAESLKYLEWRFEQYPLFREFMSLYGEHRGQVVMDYGCGPGNDVVGFLAHSKAAKVIGVDISDTALSLARRRLDLHGFDASRFDLIQTCDTSKAVPLATESVDYIYCEGVLHHTSNPRDILADFGRVLRPGGKACIMVYNRDSVWLHLYTAYEKMILQGEFKGLDIDSAFARNTDGVECPIARCYSGSEFSAICERAEFEVEYVGGYLSLHELGCLKRLARRAVKDDRLAPMHRQFLQLLTYDQQGFPMFEGKHAGVGGVYRLRKAG